MDLGNDRKYLVLQGGGALGAYQAGAYEALHIAGVRPEWIAGISIGAINAAIIAGSPDEKRVENLRRFWETATSGPGTLPLEPGQNIRKWLNEYSSAVAATMGVNGFYIPRALMPWQYIADPKAAISLYDTTPLIDTLNSLVDFDLVNSHHVRLSLGAVDVVSGNFAYFDTHPCRLRREPVPLTARHVAASGALPPGFPPVEIDGRYYWDGGLVSNTPFQWVIDERDTREDICVFQIDLFSARGLMPSDMSDVLAREKEIRYSSRTRLNTSEAARHERTEKALRRLLDRLPPQFADDSDVRYLRSLDDRGAVTAVHLIYARKPYETHSMDNEFSRLTMEEHWRAGYDDVTRTFASPQWKNRVIPSDGFVSIDYRRDHARPEEDYMNLQGKIAIVTGAASGIGYGIAKRYVEGGARVAIADLKADAAEAAAAELTTMGPGEAIGIAMDVTSEDAVNEGVADVVAKWGTVDVLVSNAGIQIVNRVEDFVFSDWKKMLAIHLDGAFLTTKACLPYMQKQKSGAIVYMGSVHSKEASPAKSAYITAKHGLLGLARSVAKENGIHGVRSNVICPGFVRTPLVEKQIPEQAKTLGISEEEVVKKVMLGQTVDGEFTTIEDVAEIAFIFAAFPTNALTGQSLIVSHGWHVE